MNLDLDGAYLDSLGDSDSAFSDGVLTAEELANDPEAAALVAALEANIAQTLGVDPSTIEITVRQIGHIQRAGIASFLKFHDAVQDLTDVAAEGRRSLVAGKDVKVRIGYTVDTDTFGQSAKLRDQVYTTSHYVHRQWHN